MTTTAERYDPEARRETPLAIELKARIRSERPLTVSEYVANCLHDPEHGYYRSQAAIGRSADFITAPEISQVFGELVGVWLAVVWQQLGSPNRCRLIELGPGRGTLLADALRAATRVPDFVAALEISLVESNPILAASQRRLLTDYAERTTWFATLSDLAAHETERTTCAVPTLVIANEFLDALPVAQLIYKSDGWQPRWIGLDNTDRLIFLDDGPHPWPDADQIAPSLGMDLGDDAVGHRPGNIGDILTFGRFHELAAVFDHFERVACLVVDYGWSGAKFGDTLQAIRAHSYEHPLTSPGEADLTFQVDFEDVCTQLAGSDRYDVDGPIPQAEFLGHLGIVQRASRLMSHNPHRAGEIESAVARLLAPNGMGTRFKALGLRSTDIPTLPGFPPSFEPAPHDVTT
ncbi:MAG: SAM-dependent methyltransferase [Pseudomonadota bacterium]